jgi:YVTN family beta-propeller protein
MKSHLLVVIFGLLLITSFSSCKKDKKDDPEPFNDGCYPPAVAEIIVKKCATAGCHNTLSKDGASGLDLSSWESMFAGNRNGATTIPFRSDQSTLFYFVNTDTTLGVVQQPTMPYNSTPLSIAEILTIRNWIDAGAPNCNGEIKFADNPNRKKFYVANQGCDLIGVHDAETRVIMRYVDVGNSPSIESPHMIKVSPDGQYWYVSFINSTVFQKYRTSDDTFVGEAVISQGSWNTFVISPDGATAYVIDFSTTGRIAYVDLNSMQLIHTFSDPGLFSSPHGSALDNSGNTLYVTNQLGNTIYKFDLTNWPPDYEQLSINTSGSANPHEIAFSPDGSKYFITCSGTNEVKVFNTADDMLITSINTDAFPLEMSFSPSRNYLFVTCESGNSVTVIDINTLSAVKNINTGFVPHGLAVNETKGVVYVANRNNSTGGPAPHHTSSCGAALRNGYLTIIDMNTLELIPGFKMELSVDPYSVSVRN